MTKQVAGLAAGVVGGFCLAGFLRLVAPHLSDGERFGAYVLLVLGVVFMVESWRIIVRDE